MLPERRGDCSADGDRVPAVASSSGAAVSEQSAIEWTDATWNPVTGCTKVSPGCANCYIERTPPFRMAGRRFVKGAIPVLLHPERLDQPLRWRKPRWVFLCSLADLFHEDGPEGFIQQGVVPRGPLVGPVDLTPWLTPLPELEAETCQRCNETGEEVICCDDLCANSDECIHGDGYAPCSECGGVGQIIQNARPAIDWVIVGGESGPGSAERKLVERRGAHSVPGQYVPHDAVKEWRPKPQALEWLRSLRDQCVAAGVPVFFIADDLRQAAPSRRERRPRRRWQVALDRLQRQHEACLRIGLLRRLPRP